MRLFLMVMNLVNLPLIMRQKLEPALLRIKNIDIQYMVNQMI